MASAFNVVGFMLVCCCRCLVTAFSSPSEASSLLDFKSKADLQDKLKFSGKTAAGFCKWEGVYCSSSVVVKVVIENRDLGGVFAAGTLTRLHQLRVLSLQNNSLTGPIPDLSGLVDLKALFLSNNYFSGGVPPSVSSLHRLRTVDLSRNMLAGPIPASLTRLDRLVFLRLDFNRLNGSVPAFNQSGLEVLNVSHNALAGTVPMTPVLSHFNASSFSLNPGICGEIIHVACPSTRPFFGQSAAAPPKPPAALSQTAQPHGGGEVELSGKGSFQKHKRAALVIGFSLGASLIVISLLCLGVAARRRRQSSRSRELTKVGLDPSVTGNTEAAVIRIEEENDELEEKVKAAQAGKLQMVGRSGSLVFCAGEPTVYAMDQLMRASAELLGRGTMGTTYKAVLDSRLIVTVKRLDGGRLGGSSSQETFEGHMESVGGLRHHNLVPLRAYFQGKDNERLLIYDYYPNGSLSSLIHGSKPAKSKPLHWTSCLKITEDVARGLCFIHQAWRLVHGNLKSSNVLLGSDFEACLTDYCLTALACTNSNSIEEDSAAAYKDPELLRKSGHGYTSKSDVYSFGVLVIELLTGKHPAQHPDLSLDDMIGWMRSVREDDRDDQHQQQHRLEMLLEVGMACRTASPDQRPTMCQVLKMIQEIKDAVLMEDNDL